MCLLSRKGDTVKAWRYRGPGALREVAAWLAYLCDSSVFVDFYEGWTEKVHPVVAKQPIQPLDLFLSVGLVDNVLTRWQVLESANLTEEFLHLSSGLVHIDDFGRPAAHAGP